MRVYNFCKGKIIKLITKERYFMRKNIIVFSLLLSSLALNACAKSSKEIAPSYVSPLQYSGRTCSQLEREMAAVSVRVTELAGRVNKEAHNDNVAMGTGLIFWPALFLLDGDTPQAAEYARLRGEFDAIEKAAIEENCGFKIERPKAPEPEVKKDKPKYPGAKN